MILNNVLTHIFTQWSKERDRQSDRIHLQVLGQYFNPSSPSHVLSTSDLPRHGAMRRTQNVRSNTYFRRQFL
jgi:hypothetical protein